MDKHVLVNFVEQGKSQREIADLLDLSHSTIRYWLWKLNLKTKNEKRVISQCGKCGETDSQKMVTGSRSRYLCKKCDNLRNLERITKIKKQCLEYKGNKCIKCGYNKCHVALEFHHRDASQKDPEWKKIRVRNFVKIKQELDKCDLLCSNCHRELHWELLQLRV